MMDTYSKYIISPVLRLKLSKSFKIFKITLLLCHSFFLLTININECIAITLNARAWKSTLLEAPVHNTISNSDDGSTIIASQNSILEYSLNLNRTQYYTTGSLYKNNLLLLKIDKSILSCWAPNQLSNNNTINCIINFNNNLSNEIHAPWGDKINATNHVIPRLNALFFKKKTFIITSDRPYSLTNAKSSPLDGIGHYKLFTQAQIPRVYLEQTSHITQVNYVDSKTLSFNYVYSFISDQHQYFILNDIWYRNLVPQSQTKIARICNNDTHLGSYIELPLYCPQAEDMSASKASYIKAQDEGNLQVIFEYSDKQAQNRNFPVLCTYSLKYIENHFDLAVKDCYEGGAKSHLLNKVYSNTQPCYSGVEEDYCTSKKNQFIEGGSVFQVNSDDSLTLDKMDNIEFIYNDRQADKNVVFIGTKSGQVTKILGTSLLYTLNLFQDSITYYNLEKFLPMTSDINVITSNYDSNFKTINIFSSNNQFLQINATSCQYYANCEQCLQTGHQDPMDCVWCQGRCLTKNDCINYSSDSCPPTINSFYPKIGPLNGNTKLTILGENFGSSNRTTSVTIGENKCDITNVFKTKVECLTPPSTYPSAQLIKISVIESASSLDLFKEEGTALSELPFTYNTLEIYSSNPQYGPQSGGTIIKVEGRNLDIGLNRSIFIGDISCKVIEESSKESKCVSGPKYDLENLNMSLKFIVDGQKIETNLNFEYKANPEILKIEPLDNIISSKQTLDIIGKNLDSVSNPSVRYFMGKQNHSVNCMTKSSSQIVCPQPSSFELSVAFSAEHPIVIRYEVYLDGLNTYEAYIKHLNARSIITYYPEPNFKGVSGFELQSDQITFFISGSNFSLPIQMNILMDADNDKLCFNKVLKNSSLLTCTVEKKFIDRSKPHFFVVNVGAQKYQLNSFMISNTTLTELPSTAKHSAYSDIVFLAVIVAILTVLICLIVAKKFGKVWKIFGKSNLKNSHPTDNDTVMFQNPSSQKFIGTKFGESLKDLVKINGSMSSEYFTHKPEKVEPTQPLMSDFVDREMICLLMEEKILIDRKLLTLGHVLGSGQFGRVYKGFLRLEDRGEHLPVAVKTLHSRTSWYDGVDNRAFLEEGLMMRDFQHENVLALIGVSFDASGLPMVITPFMLHGDLRSFIADDACTPKVRDLIDYGTQVAKGMAYLSNLKFVHRDLAARNCMLNEDLVVKIADFGLSRDIYERDYYSSDNKKAKLPVKWMAIESLEKNIYNTKTDVWSYGVLLWELMTRGVVPYPNVDNFDLFKYLKEGRRMLRPFYCPKLLYGIMLSCWDENSDRRPSFEELVVSVSGVITELEFSENGHQKVNRDKTYCDFPT